MLSIGIKVDDLGWPWTAISSNFLGMCTTSHFWEAARAKRMKIDPHWQRRNCCTLKAYFGIDIAGRSSTRICRALTFVLARLSCLYVFYGHHSNVDLFSRYRASNISRWQRWLDNVDMDGYVTSSITWPLELLYSISNDTNMKSV